MRQSLGGSSLAAFVAALDSIGWVEPEDVADATYYLVAAAWAMARRHHVLMGRAGELPRPKGYPWKELLDDIESGDAP